MLGQEPPTYFRSMTAVFIFWRKRPGEQFACCPAAQYEQVVFFRLLDSGFRAVSPGSFFWHKFLLFLLLRLPRHHSEGAPHDKPVLFLYALPDSPQNLISG